MNIFDGREVTDDQRPLRLFIAVAVGVITTAILNELFPGLSTAAKLVGYLVLIIGITLVLGFIGGYFMAYELTVMCNTPADVENLWGKISNKFFSESFSRLRNIWRLPLWLRRKVKQKKIVCVSTKKENLEYLKQKLPYVFKDSEIKKKSILVYLAGWPFGKRLSSYRDLFHQKLVAFGAHEELREIADRLKPRLKKSFGKSAKLEYGESKNKIWLNMTRYTELAPFKYKVVFDKPSNDEAASIHIFLHYSGLPLKNDRIGSMDTVEKDFGKFLKVVEKVTKEQKVDTERDACRRVVLTHSISRKNEQCFEIRSLGSVPDSIYV